MTPRILLVDDNPINLKLVADLLDWEGLQVDRASDATGALACITAHRPDLILMDIEMPGMDGLTLTRRLKADPATAGIPIVALTAYAMKGDEARALEAGCNGYLTKPVNTRTLGHEVRRFLPGASV